MEKQSEDKIEMVHGWYCILGGMMDLSTSANGYQQASSPGYQQASSPSPQVPVGSPSPGMQVTSPGLPVWLLLIITLVLKKCVLWWICGTFLPQKEYR